MKEVIVKNISIGDELLIGQVINTNAAWLGEHLSEAGYNLKSVLTVGDSEKAILDAFEACMDADLVLVGIVLKAERLPLNVGIGICQGMVPIVAYNYASKNYKRMDEVAF